MAARVGEKAAAGAAAAAVVAASGGAGAAAAAAAGILALCKLQAYGVLGVGKVGRNFVERGPAPGSTDIVVDPAGLHHIQPPGGPSGAGGAAASVYTWCAISSQRRFRKQVIEEVTETACASSVQDYGEGRYVIHVVGPRLHGKAYDGKEGRGVSLEQRGRRT